MTAFLPLQAWVFLLFLKPAMKGVLICFLVVTFLLAGYSLGRGQETILKIDVTGNERIDRGVVAAAVKTKEKEAYDPEKIRDDIKNIYKTGFFSDVQVDVKDSPDGKTVTFVVVERPPISAIAITGNKEIKTEDLKDKIKIKTGSVLNVEKVKETVDEIKKHYASKNYYAAKVSYDIDYEEGYRAKVTFVIDEARKVYVKKITFTGNKHFKAGTLTDYMKTKEKGILSWFTGSGTLDDEVLDEDRRNLGAFYADNGYIKTKVDTPEINLSEDGKQISITIPISEGAMYKVGSIAFSGDIVIPEEQLRALLQTKLGTTFRASLFQQDVTSITDLCQDQGYAFADVAPLTGLDDATDTVNITFAITKGSQVFVNRINITGNVKTRDKVIRRELRFTEGDLFSASKLKESKRRLRNTTFFKESDLKIVKTDDPGKVHIDAIVEERSTGSISAGIGYSSYEKVMLTGSLSQENIFGTGIRASLSAALSSITQLYDLAIWQPYLFDLDLGAGINLFNQERSFDTYDYKTRGGAIPFLRPISDRTKIGLRYGYNKTDVYNIDPFASAYVKSQRGELSTSSVTGSLGYNSIDDMANPSKGTFNDYILEVAGGPFGGDNQFVRSIVTYGRFFPFKWDTVFFVRGTAGSVQPYSGGIVPIYDNFFVGGINTVRGFEYGTAGPIDSTDTPVGGQNELFFNFEFIFPIVKSAGLKGLVFFDAGHGFNNNTGWFNGIRTAAGFGLRWLSPMGPIRLEMGFNLSPKQGEKANVFEFMIGRAF
jgi:outer membrane protein insertion porin family